MKWLLALLLVANAALFMWGRWYREPLVDPAPPAPPRDVAQEKIKLLSEPGVRLLLRSRDEAAAAAPALAATPSASGAQARCYRLGPFEQAAGADAAAAVFRARGFEYQRVAEPQTAPLAYYVYLPPLPSRQAAERRRRELTQRGLRDHALMQEEGFENAISLGVFSVEGNARARVVQLARQGIEARVRAVAGTPPRYWLALASTGDRAEELERLARRERPAPGAALQARACPATAPPASRPSG